MRKGLDDRTILRNCFNMLRLRKKSFLYINRASTAIFFPASDLAVKKKKSAIPLCSGTRVLLLPGQRAKIWVLCSNKSILDLKRVLFTLFINPSQHPCNID